MTTAKRVAAKPFDRDLLDFQWVVRNRIRHDGYLGWHASIRELSDDDDSPLLGEVFAIVIPEASGGHLYDTLDALSGDLALIASVLIDDAGSLSEDVIDEFGSNNVFGDTLLVIDRVEFVPGARKRDLLRIVLDELVTVTCCVRLVALLPGPLTELEDKAEHARAVSKIGANYQAHGFHRVNRKSVVLVADPDDLLIDGLR